MDLLDLQRLFTALAMPLPASLLLLGVALVLGLSARTPRSDVALACCVWLLLLVASSPLFAQRLMATLERPFPPKPPEACPRADAIVLLGGGMQPRVASDERGRINQGADRVWEAAQLYHAGCAPLVLISGGGTLVWPVTGTEADATRALLLDLRVPAAAIVTESTSRDTQQNALYLSTILPPAVAPRILLLSSAWHLRRAVPLFEHLGYHVLPVGADYHGFRRCRTHDCWMPSAAALAETGLVIKEYLGYWIEN